MKYQRREAIGYWLTGMIVVAGLAAIIGTVIWSLIRTGTETREGGWSRTVINQDLSIWPYMIWTFTILAVAWTLGSIAYYLTRQSEM